MFILIFLWIHQAHALDPFANSYFVKDALGPLVTGASSGDLSAESCAACHAREYSDWSHSRHRISFVNQNFFEGYVREKQDRCLNCHAPLFEQQREIKEHPTLKLAHEGVNCATCHVRDGKITGAPFHGTQPLRELKDPKFCAACHEFDINGIRNGEIHLTDVNAQNTYSQWLQYKKAGGSKTCQECHMPEGRHLFQGAHDRKNPPLLIDQPMKGILRIRLKDIGHNYPSGDVFRRVTLELQRGNKFEVLRSFTRTYAKDGSFGIESDTTLAPFATTEVKIPGPRPVRYRFVYHFLKDQEKEYSRIPKADQERVIAEGIAH